MKFGSQLKDAIYLEWRENYIDYDGLKKKLRKAEKDRPFTEKDETEFVEVLDSNLEKIYAFHQRKMEEIMDRMDEYERTVEQQQSADESELGRTQEKINQIADDVNRLARYSRLNYTGFLKIVKKHDRHTNYVLRPMFMVRLNQCPFWKQDYDSILIKLSELFAQARQGGKRMSFKKPSVQLQKENASDFSQTVVKRYFVPLENILELKTHVLRHLPVLVYRDNSLKEDDIDPPISSLYLDNQALDAYNTRVESASGSQIVRLRWYGSAKNNASIAVELRTLADEERGELTNRFVIKDKYVNGFLQGDQTFIQKSVNKMRAAPGKSEEDVERHEKLLKDVQKMIMEQHMQPVLRTYYRRTAFQIPGDKRVRMALDTDLCFIREDSHLFPNDPTTRRAEGQWHRPDADIDFPFKALPPGDVNRYPFATFEIKLDLAPGESEPDWVTDLEESDMLEEAHQFSKFVHGVAILFDTRVALLPYWLAQIDDEAQPEIRLSRSPSAQGSTAGKGKASSSAGSEDVEDVQIAMEPQMRRRQDSRKPSSEASPTERTSLLGQRGPTSYMGISSASKSSTATPSTESTGFADRLLTFPQRFGETFQRLVNPTPRRPEREPVILPPGVKVPQKVVTPLRVEPKVFFANERTYFSWMSFGSLMATFSIALFNAGDAVGKISGVVYTLVSLSTLIYGMGLYYRRRELIRARAAGPYDDVMGPTVICCALLFAVGLNAYLKFTVKSPTLFYI